MENEVWVDIKGYEGLYQISDMGRVKSLTRKYSRVERVLIPCINKDGYYQVVIYKDRIKARPFIHRLVGTHFDVKGSGDEINHGDGVKSNNKATNLTWSTRLTNMQHAFSTGLMNISRGNNWRAKWVLNLQTGIFYDNTFDAAASANLNRSTLINNLSGHKNNKTNFVYV